MLSVYKASAGSGKTFALAFEYIKLVLGSKDPETGKYRLNKSGRERHRPVLAITFTNKATDEMKRRIIHELAVLAGVDAAEGATSPYAGKLMSLFGCTAEELSQSAYSALHELLFDFNFFNISTIDAFFQNVLRIFAREAELTGNYDVELDDRYATGVGVNNMLLSINYDTQNGDSRRLSEWLKQFMLERLDEGKSFNMFNRSSKFHDELINFAGNLSSEKFKLHSDALLDYLNDDTRISDFDAELKRRSEAMLGNCEEMALRALNLLTMNGLPTEKYVNLHVMSTLKKWVSGVHAPLKTTCQKAIDAVDSRYYKDVVKKGNIVGDVDRAIVEALSTIDGSLPLATFYASTRRQLYVLGMLGDIFRYISDFRNDNNLILLSDTNDLLRRIISEDDAPFIYERVGVRLKHFLIDEFQDTSKLQWENLSPLVSESLSTGNDNLIIGDEKQCIYRFRNSDPSLLRTEVAGQFAGSTSEHGNDLSGNTNWRSSADVVRFNNTLFTYIAEASGMNDIYRNVVQQVSPAHTGHRGYVKATCIDAPTVDDFDTETLPLMAAEIKRQLDAGYRQSDITVLVRQRSEGEKVINFLLNYPDGNPEFPRLNIISDDALGINNSPAVRLIVSVLRFIDTPDSLDGVSDNRYLSPREITRLLNRYEYFMSRDNSPSEALGEALRSEAVIDSLADEAATMECVSLPSIVERIIMRYIPETSLDAENAFISAFQDTVIDFCSRGTSDLHSFIKWWDTTGNRTCLSSPPDMDALKVMTIHKSKGLEFKCVHIPYATWAMAKDKDIHWFTPTGFETFPAGVVPPVLPMQSSSSLMGTPLEEEYLLNRREEIADTLNVTYVAFTRAVDELIINYQCADKATENMRTPIGYYIKRAAENVTAGYCEEKAAVIGDGLSVKSGDIFIPIREYTSEGITKIGIPAVSVPRKGDGERAGNMVKITPYFSSDRDDLWKMSRIEDVCDMERPRDRGIMLHDMLGDVRHLDDIPVAVRRHSYRLNLTESEILELISYLRHVTSQRDVAQWFDGYDRIVRERTIMLPSGDSYRPDRVVWTSGGTVDVIDYKSGEERPKEYARQVLRYMSLLSDAGYANVRGFIWYLDTGKIVQVNRN